MVIDNIEALVLQEAGEEEDVGQGAIENGMEELYLGKDSQVYDWWRTAMTEKKDKSIPIFYETVYLITATQVSSAVASLCSLNSLSSPGQLVMKLCNQDRTLSFLCCNIVTLTTLMMAYERNRSIELYFRAKSI